MLASLVLTYMRNTKKSVYYASNYTHEEKTTTYPVHYHRLSGGLRSDGIRGHESHTELWSRHPGIGGEFNASSADFAPAAMGYEPMATYNQVTQASKPSAWNK